LQVTKTPIQDVEFLRTLKRLERLHLEDVSGIDLSPLLGLPNFKDLIARGDETVDQATLNELTSRGVTMRILPIRKY